MAVKSNFAAGDVLTSSAVNTYLTNGGLVYVTETSFTGSSSVSINSCFSATYENYLIIVNLVSSQSGNLRMKLRNGTTDKSANYYWGAFYLDMNSGTPTLSPEASAGTVTTGFRLAAMNSTGVTTVFANIGSPYTTTRTTCQSQPQSTETYWRLMGSNHNENYSADGITVAPDAGTVTGTIRVYGYRQA